MIPMNCQFLKFAGKGSRILLHHADWVLSILKNDSRSRNGVMMVVSRAIITRMEKTGTSINPFCNAILAITSSIIPLALSPKPMVIDFVLLKPASLEPKYPPSILLKKEAIRTAVSNNPLFRAEKSKAIPMVAKNIGARKPMAKLVVECLTCSNSDLSKMVLGNSMAPKKAPTMK